MSVEEATGADGGLDGIFKQFRDSLVAELKKKEQANRELQLELANTKQENADLLKILKANPQADQNATATHYRPTESRKTKSKDPEETVSFAKYSELQQKYHTTYKSMETVLLALDRYKAKHKKQIDSIRQWQDYADRCERKLADRKGLPTPERSSIARELHRPTTVASELSSPTPTSDCDALFSRVRKPASRCSLVSVENAEEAQRQLSGPSKLVNSVMAKPSPLKSSARALSSAIGPIHSESPVYDTIIGRVQELRSSQTEGSDDLPDFQGADRAQSAPATNHEFCVPQQIPKRKHEALQSDANDREGLMDAPIHIKSEPRSSPRAEPSVGLYRTETLDLDETGDHIETPRKRQRMMLQQSSSFSMSFPPPRAGRHPPMGKYARDLPSKDVPHWRTLSAKTPLQYQEQIATNGDGTSIKTKGVRLQSSTSVLDPLNPNQNDLPREKESKGKPKSRKPKSKQRGAEWESVAEDHDDFSTISPASLTGRHSANNLLDFLLDNPAPAKQMLITPATARKPRISPAVATPIVQKVNNISHQVTLANKKLATPSPNGCRRAIEQRNPLRDPAPENRSSMEKVIKSATSFKEPEILVRSNRPPLKASNIPLRDRSISNLRLDDFKISPRAYGDLDHTNADPVRDRESRRHLNGCTDPNCFQCGDALRALAEALPITVGSTLFANTQEDDLTDEERLLKHHLGHRFDREWIARMPEVQRNGLVMEAKLQIVADRHSRHRMRPNARAKSPPGFWDVDMPTTQELDERNAQADARLKEIVRDRYREAMRPGGRWIFRDE